MKRATAADRKLMTILSKQTAAILGPVSNPHFTPDKATINRADAPAVLRVNNFIRRAFMMMARKFTGTDRKIARFRAAQVHEVSKRVEKTFKDHKRTTPLIVVGTDAVFYFGALDAVYRVFKSASANYIEASKDPKRASVVSQEVLWDLRSLIQVGRIPAEKSRFLP